MIFVGRIIKSKRKGTKIGRIEVAICVYVCITSMMIANGERWKLSTLELHLSWSVKKYLLGK